MWRYREINRFAQCQLYEKSKSSVCKMSPYNRNGPVHFVPFVLCITKIEYHQDKCHSETQKARKILLFRMWTVFISSGYEYFCSGLVWCVQTLQWTTSLNLVISFNLRRGSEFISSLSCQESFSELLFYVRLTNIE